MAIAVLGIDLGKNSCSVAGLDGTGRVVFTGLERPYLFLETLIVNPWEGSKGGLLVEFQFKNFGRTPAIVRTIEAGIGLWVPKRVTDPLPLSYDTVGDISLRREHVIAAGGVTPDYLAQQINIADHE